MDPLTKESAALKVVSDRSKIEQVGQKAFFFLFLVMAAAVRITAV